MSDEGKAPVDGAVEKCIAALQEIDTAARGNDIGCFSLECVPQDAVETMVGAIDAMLASGPRADVMKAWGDAGGTKIAPSLLLYLQDPLEQWQELEPRALDLLALYPKAYLAHPAYLDDVLAEEGQTVLTKLLDILEDTLAPPSEAGPKAVLPPKGRALAVCRVLNAVVSSGKAMQLFNELGGPPLLLDAVHHHTLGPIELPF